MHRREFIGAAVAALGQAPAQDGGSKYISMEWYRCRIDHDPQRLRNFLSNGAVPALNRAGIRPVGVFQVSDGPDNPSILVVKAHASLAAIQQAADRLAADGTFVAAQKALDEKWELAYDRIECWLLRSFKSMPGIEVPKVEQGKANLFELRIYESRNYAGHVRKVAMFDEGEIDLFRRTGISPVFFGSTVFGPNMPNLTYMVSFPSVEARAQAWSAFGQHPEWKKMSTVPGATDRELVCRISNQLMTPLPFSQIK
ncbi:MAG: NIPSNAP family protein [Acidobacteria bacterium]|nr:NIPSNAP family protein [Acidobacteriota bacterium]